MDFVNFYQKAGLQLTVACNLFSPDLQYTTSTRFQCCFSASSYSSTNVTYILYFLIYCSILEIQQTIIARWIFLYENIHFIQQISMFNKYSILVVTDASEIFVIKFCFPTNRLVTRMQSKEINDVTVGTDCNITVSSNWERVNAQQSFAFKCRPRLRVGRMLYEWAELLMSMIQEYFFRYLYVAFKMYVTFVLLHELAQKQH